MPEPDDARIPALTALLVAGGFERPTAAVATPDGRLFVAEKSGTIRVVVGHRVLDEPLLDLSDGTLSRGAERGLLGLALHPDFERNGRFFVHLTDLDGDSRLIEYRVAGVDPNVADPRTARTVLRVEQPGEFHNGGQLLFGPDGYLFVGMGDGGFGDPHVNAALRTNVLGSILRIDVDGGDPYSVPADNPYVGSANASEIWLSGVRNPWRFWIDAPTRKMVIGDVGQFRREEINVVPLDTGGLDLGWPTREGGECYEADECPSEGFTPPAAVYAHAAGCAVIGGPVYRGSLVPELRGRIVYADFCRGWVRAASLVEGRLHGLKVLIPPMKYGPILSIAVDADGELLILTEEGAVRRLQVDAGPVGQRPEIRADQLPGNVGSAPVGRSRG